MITRTAVPCNGCTACCRGELVVLDPDVDDMNGYLVDAATIGGVDAKVLKRKPNGDCVYLGDGGCTIWNRAPAMCRVFDCRLFFLKFTNAQRRGLPDAKDIFQAAKARLPSLRVRPSNTTQ